MSKATAVQTEKTADAEIRRDARNQGIGVARVSYNDARAPQHWTVCRLRDGSRLSKAFTCEADAWGAVPAILSEMALAHEKAQDEENQRLARYAAASAEKRKNAAKLPVELQGISLDDFPVTGTGVKIAKEFSANFEEKLKEGKGLILIGPDFSKVRMGAAILESVCQAGWSARFMDVFQVELALETAGPSAFTTPDLLCLVCYEAGPAIRAVLKAREGKPTLLVASCSLDRLTDLVCGNVTFDDDGLGLDSWTRLLRNNQVIQFPKEAR